jgi:transcriptional regulator with XRE-family HTH domain
MTTSSSLRVSDREKSYARLIGEIQHALNEALSEEYSVRGLTKAQIATILRKNKSFVTRKLSGASNMTLETLADLAWALNRPVRIRLPSRAPAGSNILMTPPPTQTRARDLEDRSFVASASA